MDAGAYVDAEEIITGLIRDYPEEAELFAFYARLMLVTFHLPKARALLMKVGELLKRDYRVGEVICVGKNRGINVNDYLLSLAGSPGIDAVMERTLGE